MNRAAKVLLYINLTNAAIHLIEYIATKSTLLQKRKGKPFGFGVNK